MNVRLENISKSYDHPVLKCINFCFESDRLYVLKGVSGCGKSTLLNIIGGVEKDFDGNVVYDPQRIRGAYIFQRSLLFSELTVRDNLMLINGNKSRITDCAEDLGIQDLLSRKPGMLSGGERQRAAIERALLRDPQLLLMDEPTASLDDENSRKIARLIYELKQKNRILIVATHESYFDVYADEILELDYGTIKKEPRAYAPEACSDPESIDIPSQTAERGAGALTFVLKRKPGLLKPARLLLTAVFFLMILIGSALKANVKSESIRMYRQDRPVDLIKLQPSVVAELPEDIKTKITIYDDYYAEDGEITAYYLLPKNLSVLGRSGAVSHGRFPKNETEVLVNGALAAALSGDLSKIGNCLGQQFVFCGENLTVSGIVESYGVDFRNDWYYAYGKDHRPLDISEQHLFISYPLLQRIGTKIESNAGIIMASCPDLWEDEALQDRLQYDEDDMLNDYLQYIRDLKTQMDYYVRVAFGVMLFLFTIACMYMVSVIRLELFYRRQELGYLQIFGLSKSSILKLIVLEYAIKAFASLLLAVGLYLLFAGGYALICNGTILMPEFGESFVMISILTVMYLFTVWISAFFYLRKSVIQLIT